MLLFVILLPLLSAALFALPMTRSWGRLAGVIAPLLPLGISLAAPEMESGVLPWLLLRTELGLDVTGRVFMLLTSFLWLAAGMFAIDYHGRDARRDAFWAFYLVSMSGNFGLILAMDMVSFYLFFAMMSFASFGLIIHDRTADTLRAGRVYLVLVVLGEVLLFLGFVGAAELSGGVRFDGARDALADSATSGLIIGLLIFGLGVKAGLIPLHVWLPLAHPAAPTAASAVLSGAMIKAGLLGWLRILPLGENDFPTWGTTLMVLGLIATYGAALVGIMQSNPKVILAYSSISQMGLMTMVVGAGLANRTIWPAMFSALLLFAMHHALAKGALFLGVGIVSRGVVPFHRRAWLACGLLVPACSLAGFPGTSGALVKSQLKYALPVEMPPWLLVMQQFMTWAAVGTSLLMIRYLWRVWPRRENTDSHEGAGMRWGWMLLVLASLGLVARGWWEPFRAAAKSSLSGQGIVASLSPILLACLLAAVVRWGHDWWCRVWGTRISKWTPPSGDILVPVTWLLARCQRLSASLQRPQAQQQHDGTDHGQGQAAEVKALDRS